MMGSILFLLCLGLMTAGIARAVTFTDCGDENKVIVVKSGSIKPDPIQYPGNVTMSVEFEVLKDLPGADFEMVCNFEKLYPRKFTVPCLDNVGSCVYDVCEMIEERQNEYCPMFPDHAECGCPAKAGSYVMKDVPVGVPDFGDIFTKVLKGRYEGNMTFFDRSTDTNLGCIGVTFEIVPPSD